MDSIPYLVVSSCIIVRFLIPGRLASFLISLNRAEHARYGLTFKIKKSNGKIFKGYSWSLQRKGR